MLEAATSHIDEPNDAGYLNARTSEHVAWLKAAAVAKLAGWCHPCRGLHRLDRRHADRVADVADASAFFNCWPGGRINSGREYVSGG